MCKTLFAFGIDAVRASPDFKPGLARIGYILFAVFSPVPPQWIITSMGLTGDLFSWALEAALHNPQQARIRTIVPTADLLN
jgi:hypothetical protein